MPSIYGPITLGELIAALEATYHSDLSDYEYVKTHGERRVCFDWCDMKPEHFHSYRGFYSEIAVTVKSHSTESVDEFLARCKAQIGATHGGWKGGDYTMREDTSVWVVPETGTCPGFGISGVKDEGYRVVLTTKNFDH